MWRKNQESQTPAPVTPKPETTKPETTTPAAVVPIVAATPVAPTSAPITPAPAPTPSPVAVAPVSMPTPNFSPSLAANSSGSDSRIGAGLKIRGEITGTSDMYIDGDVQGKVRVGSGRLTVGTGGKVQADIEAREIFVNGSVIGNLKATDRVQLGSTGTVQGSVVTPRIGIDDGARLRGNVETASASQASSKPEPVAEKEPLRVAAGQGKGD
jgi:cytoskeletal protein CcmA (bactofilin family)